MGTSLKDVNRVSGISIDNEHTDENESIFQLSAFSPAYSLIQSAQQSSAIMFHLESSNRSTSLQLASTFATVGVA